MARHTVTLNLPRQDLPQFVDFITKDFFAKEGFSYVNFKNEMVWKKGMGLLTAPEIMKVTVNGTLVTVEAWIRMAWLPGVYGGEMGLDGFVGAIPKGMLRGKVDNLVALLSQPPMAQQQYSQQGSAQ